MYLDGKYFLSKDLNEKLKMRRITKWAAEAGESRTKNHGTEKEKNNRICLYYLFEESAKVRPNKECVWSREVSYTWAEFYDQVNQYGHWYLSQGVKPGDLVAFYLQNSAEYLLAWLGLWSIGAAPAMINYNLAGKALVHCLRVPKVKLLLVDEDPELRKRIEDEQAILEGELGIKIMVMDSMVKADIRTQKTERPEDLYREGVKGTSPAALIYTRFVIPTQHAQQEQDADNVKVELQVYLKHRAAGNSMILEDDRWYTCMPLYHGTGGITSIANLMSGITNCIGKKFSTSKFWDDIRDSKATWFTYVGETARYLLAAPPSPRDKDHNVRVMYGNGMRPDVWMKFRDRFGVAEVGEFFNSTEGMFSLLNYCRGDFLATCVGHHGLLARRQLNDVYVPVRVDETSGAVLRDPKTGFATREPYEKGGEILVAVPSTAAFSGYYNNPEATSKKFEKDVFKKGDLYYRTGDALRRDKDGRWFFLDRLGDTFRWKGENVSTAEVAEVLGKYDGVVEAIVYGVQLPSHDGKAGCAAVFIDPNITNFDFAGLLKHARKHLPKYAVPIFLRLVKEMTPIHNNKQNKVPLKEEGVDHEKIKKDDKLLWIEERGKGNTYVEFHRDHWADLELGKARL
ncbi:AMP-dependent synthetase ligase protein [Rutstroemia sp. NJR-2017a BVV2]|nr:AMP-dependent synthetase ligase protein [Rutstroemia sp. NJR-2017a BVV2]